MDKIGKINFTVEMTSNIDLEFPDLKFNHLDTEAFANLIYLRVGVCWDPTAFYLKISRTIENREKCFWISNEIQW